MGYISSFIPAQNATTSTTIGLGTLGYLSTGNFFLQSSFFINSQNLISQPSYGIFTLQTGFSYTASPWGTQTAYLQTITNSYSQVALNVDNKTLYYTGTVSQSFRITYTCGGNQNETVVIRPTITMQVTSQGVTKVYQTVNNIENAGASITNVVQLYPGDSILFLVRGYQNYTFTSIDTTYYEIIVESLAGLAVSNFSTLTASSFQVNNLQLGNGTGYVNTGDLITTSLSTLQINAGTGQFINLFVGATSSFNTIQFYGLDGLYKNTAIAEVSTGVAGSKELLLFTGSTTTDRIRLQTTGDIRFEPGVSQRLFSTTQITPQAIPAMIIDSNSNVGIGVYPLSITNYKLDIAGVTRNQGLSTLQVVASSFQGDGSQLTNVLVKNTLLSTIQGLGTYGYLSTPTMNFSLQSSFFINSQNLISQPSYGIFTIQTGFSYTASPWGTQTANLQTITNNYSQIVLNVDNKTLVYTGTVSQSFRITYTCGGNQNETTVIRPTITMQVTSQGVTKVYQTVNNVENSGASITNVVQLYPGDTILFLVRSLQNYTFVSIDTTYYEIIAE